MYNPDRCSQVRKTKVIIITKNTAKAISCDLETMKDPCNCNKYRKQ